MVSRWRERDCFAAYMRSEEHARSHARIPPELDDAITAPAPRAPAHVRPRRGVTRPGPPSGAPPPQTARLPGGEIVRLLPLADLIADRYYAIYDDEAERYGPMGREWCVHDNLYLLAWAFDPLRGDKRFEEQVLWLAGVLHHRGYPVDRLARDLRIAADVVVEEQVPDAAAVAGVLREGAVAVDGFAATAET